MAKLTTRKASGTARSSTQGGKSVTAVRKILADTEPKQRPRRKAWNARKSCGAIAPRMPMGAATVDMGADANTYIGATLMDGSVEPDLVYSPTISTTLNTNKPRQQRRRKEACGGRKSCGGRAPRMPIGFATGNVDIDVNVAATKVVTLMDGSIESDLVYSLDNLGRSGY
ncbi:hypothetical protein VKT23_005153 [Stygiomarasmius scandens]|uniref:Capsid protein n=1 Tax=Marasmiellus scandens TaxID=2682957 RepID=A0ABR1JSW5_9AGAR